jgi:integrase
LESQFALRYCQTFSTGLSSGAREGSRIALVALDCPDIERVRQGLIVTLRRSKTDQDGVGRKIGIPLGRSKWCPVTALESWIEAAGIETGPIFRRVDRHRRVSAERLSGEAVCIVVRERVAAAGYDPSGFSGHSLRSGLATSAVQAAYRRGASVSRRAMPRMRCFFGTSAAARCSWTTPPGRCFRCSKNPAT